MRRSTEMGIGIGAPTIIMIFVTLCLIVLASLALLTADQNMARSLSAADYADSYYRAVADVEAQLAAVEADAAQGIAPSETELRAPLSDRQELVVRLRVEAGAARIMSHRVVNTEEWSYEAETYSDLIDPTALDGE